MSKIQLIVDATGEPPFKGSIGITNKYIHDALRRAGMHSEYLCVPQSKANSAEKLIPLVEAELVARLRADSSIDLRFFGDRALRTLSPDALSRGKNAVFFQGVAYGSQAYLQSGRISGYCANSRYLMDTLLMLVLFPQDANLAVSIGDWPAIRPVFAAVPLVAPCLEYPYGYPSPGGRLTAAQQRLLNQDSLLVGHSVRLGKADALAFAGIMFHLDRLSRDAGYQATRLFVDDITFRGVETIAPLLPVRFEPERYFESVGSLQNTELYRVMGRSRFGLCYDWFPEPFGLYPLESVFSGVPIFTNGVGNLRHLLPDDHGIAIFDPPELNTGGLESRFAATESVARRILASIMSGADRQACQRGASFIREHYNVERFSEGIVRFVEACLEPDAVPAADVSQITLQLSPLVRRWDAAERLVISDYKSLHVSPAQCDLLNGALGMRVDELTARLDRQSRALLRELYADGVVTFALPCGNLCRFAPVGSRQPMLAHA